MNILPLPPKPVTIDVKVIFDDGWYVAECDGLHIVTEADSFDALMARVWEIAPEMAQENGLNIAAHALRLRFSFEDAWPAQRVM